MAIKPSEYRKNLLKTVVAPSGAEFVIRRIRGKDILLSMGDVPLALYRAMTGEEVQLTDPEDIKAGLKLMDAVIIAGVVDPKIVDKPPEECGENELSIRELTDEDTMFLYSKIMEMNTGGRAGQEAIESFLTEGNSGSDRHDGEEIS